MYTFAYLGMQTIVIILVLVLLVFGPQKVPEIGRQIGGALRDLKKMSNEVQQAFDIDEHLSYDRYEPPTYEYHPPVETTHPPLDQYGLTDDHPQTGLIEAAPEPAIAETAIPHEAPEGIGDEIVTHEPVVQPEPVAVATNETEKSESVAETPHAQGAKD